MMNGDKVVPSIRAIPQRALHNALLRALHNALLRAQKDDRLELDEVWSFEVWSFVGHKKNWGWLWCVQCKGTRQIVAEMPGQRDIVTAGDVGAKEPSQYKDGLCFADELEAYAHVIPPEQLHQQTKMEYTNSTHQPSPEGYRNASTPRSAHVSGASSVRPCPTPNPTSSTSLTSSCSSTPIT